MTDQIAENICFLLWRERVERYRWPAQLAAWAGCDERRAGQILRGSVPSTGEAEAIARAVNVPEEDLRYARLLEDGRTKILVENLRYLVGSLEHGQKKLLAADLRVHATTLSKWSAGTQRPEKPNLVGLCRHFGLSAGTDLEAEPLFLSPLPVSLRERKRWLHEQIDHMDAGTLSTLFPALTRLLRTDESD